MINEDLDGKTTGVTTDSFKIPPWKVRSFLVKENEPRNEQQTETSKEMTQIIVVETRKDEASPNNNPQVTAQSLEIYQQISKILFRSGIMFGVKGNFEWKTHKSLLNWHLWFEVYLVWVLIAYSFIVYYFNGDKIRLMQPIAVLGQTVACSQNMYMLKHWHRMLALMFDFGRISRQHSSGTQAEVIKTGLLTTLKMMKSYCVGVVICVSFFLFAPVKTLLVNNEFVPFMPIEVIFCNQSTLHGYVTANLVLANLGTLSALNTMFFGSLFIVLILYYVIKVKLFRKDFEDLDRMWDSENNISLAYKRAFLKNIAKKREDMKRYLGNLKDMYENQLFIYFFFNYLSQIVCLFEVIEKDWLAGYALAALLFMQMLFYCFMGTKVSIANDELRDIIWESRWYIYDSESKLIISNMLQEAVRDQDIQLGPIGPLNIVTGITIIKSIYSYYTVLTELF